MTRPWAASAPADAGQFLHQIGIRQAVEAVAPDALRPRSAAGSAASWRHARHVAVKRRVEARHLGQVGMTLSERLDQLDLARQVIRVVRLILRNSLDQLGRDPFG